MESKKDGLWKGLKGPARARLETRDYSKGSLAEQLVHSGVSVGDVIDGRDELEDVWIPGVEIFPRRIFQQKGRGYFSELTRVNEGVLERIGLSPRQWASALMHRDSAKGFHIHPPHVPVGVEAAEWFRGLYVDSAEDYSRRPYDREQWDVMFFVQGIAEMILVDERAGMPRNQLRCLIDGDDRPGKNNYGLLLAFC